MKVLIAVTKIGRINYQKIKIINQFICKPSYLVPIKQTNTSKNSQTSSVYQTITQRHSKKAKANKNSLFCMNINKYSQKDTKY